MTITNGVIKNLYENNPNPPLTIASPSQAYFMNCQGPTGLTLYNVTADNVIFKSILFVVFFSLILPSDLNLISFTVNDAVTGYTWPVTPTADIRDFTLKNSRNANLVFFLMDTINLTNVYFENLSVKDVVVYYSPITLIVGHAVNVYNFTANNVYGSVFTLQNAMANNFTNCNFNNMTNSQSQDIDKQSIAYIYKVTDPIKKKLDPTRPQFTLFDNFNVNVIEIFMLRRMLMFLLGIL